MAIVVKIKLDGLEKLRKAIVGNAELAEAIAHAWSTIYRSFTRLRFSRFSRGGGDWAPLKPATLKRRRQGKGKGVSAAILVDTAALFSSLQPTLGSASALLQTSPLKPVGMRGELKSSKTYADGPTLAEVASYHHFGEGNLPARVILAQPDENTIRQMGDHGKRIIVKRLNDR